MLRVMKRHYIWHFIMTREYGNIGPFDADFKARLVLTIMPLAVRCIQNSADIHFLTNGFSDCSTVSKGSAAEGSRW